MCMVYGYTYYDVAHTRDKDVGTWVTNGSYKSSLFNS